MMNQEEILEKIRKERERLRALGVSEEREERYYNGLSIDSRDPEEDGRAFAKAIDGLNLSAIERAFVKEVLDLGDGRGSAF
jgi:hypothetical protein